MPDRISCCSNITIDNSAHIESDVKQIIFNSEKLEDNYIPADRLAEVNEIKGYYGMNVF